MKCIYYHCKNMKTMASLHKQNFCSVWQNNLLRFSETLVKRNVSSFYVHGKTRCHNETHLRSNFVNTHYHLPSLNCMKSHRYLDRLYSQRTAGFHTLSNSCMSDVLNVTELKNLCRRNTVIGARGSSRSSRTVEEENEEKLLHKYMMEKMAIENGMLSWFRNTYILTLVSVASMQLETTPIPSVAGGIAVTTAVMNISVATGKYITTFLKLKRTDRLHGTPFEWHVLFSVIHYILLMCLFWTIFPGVDKIVKEWTAYRGKDT